MVLTTRYAIRPRSTFLFITRANPQPPTWATITLWPPPPDCCQKRKSPAFKIAPWVFSRSGDPMTEVYPGQPDWIHSSRFPRTPENRRTSSLLATDLDHVLDGARLLAYLVVAFSYRDRTTPKDNYRISESCEYFVRTLQSASLAAATVRLSRNWGRRRHRLIRTSKPTPAASSTVLRYKFYDRSVALASESAQEKQLCFLVAGDTFLSWL